MGYTGRIAGFFNAYLPSSAPDAPRPAGWRLHEIAAYAGHRDPRTTQIYLHLSGTDLSAKMAGAIAEQDRRVASQVFGCPEVSHAD